MWGFFILARELIKSFQFDINLFKLILYYGKKYS
jgi:hypothetical protein